MPDPLAKNTAPLLSIPDFSTLVGAIQQLHTRCVETTNRSVNRALTLRNWHIGAHIHHFELHGSDRANYGDQLLNRLAELLTNLSNCNKRQLYRYLQFYRVYPGIVDTASPQFSLPSTTHIFQSSPADNQIVGTASPHSEIPAELLLSKCTYSHLELLVAVGDSLKRAFYEDV